MAGVLAAVSLTAPARAADGAGTGAKPRFELSAGAQAFERAWSLYSGLTWSPFGGVQADGWRVRAAGGYGGHSYESGGAKFHGNSSFADLLIGYHQQLGPVTLKAFAGVAAVDSQSDDPNGAFQGTGLGGKAVIEAWWTVADRAWASLDLSGGVLPEVYDAVLNSRVRLGWRVTPAISAGLEAAAAGNIYEDHECVSGRLGMFARYEWSSGEISLSGGLSVSDSKDRLAETTSSTTGPFATFSWLTRF
jgi:hypothetical protein